jgi:hypothetical protein
VGGTFGQGAFVLAASLGVSGFLIFGGTDTAQTADATGPSYSQSVSSFVAAVDAKYDGAVPANDAAAIALSVCQAFDADADSAYDSFTSKAASIGMESAQADFMARTAVQKVCPRHRSDLR